MFSMLNQERENTNGILALAFFFTQTVLLMME